MVNDLRTKYEILQEEHADLQDKYDELKYRYEKAMEKLDDGYIDLEHLLERCEDLSLLELDVDEGGSLGQLCVTNLTDEEYRRTVAAYGRLEVERILTAGSIRLIVSKGEAE